MTSSAADKKHLRRLGHNLKPIVTIANKGLTDSVNSEIDRALNDHELIKIKVSVGDRDAKKLISEEI
ncbi:MAG: YhbY family RNA-binding protein, partial [Porticoccaceae bacterium]